MESPFACLSVRSSSFDTGIPELAALCERGELKLGPAEYVARWPHAACQLSVEQIRRTLAEHGVLCG
jgi:hypothetical protein